MGVLDPLILEVMSEGLKGHRAVVRIEIDQAPAFLQNAEPFAVSGSRVRQCPGEIAGEDEIKRFILEVQCLSGS